MTIVPKHFGNANGTKFKIVKSINNYCLKTIFECPN